jgi:hypothetical protein
VAGLKFLPKETAAGVDTESKADTAFSTPRTDSEVPSNASIESTATREKAASDQPVTIEPKTPGKSCLKANSDFDPFGDDGDFKQEQ